MTDKSPWRLGGVFLLGAVALAALLGAWWLFSGQHTDAAHLADAASGARVQGELFSNPPPSASPSHPPDMTDAESKKRHPKPPSVQRRMVLAEAAFAQPGNLGALGQASGTLGTAAVWAKSNGTLTTNVAATAVQLPGYQSISFNELSAFPCLVSADDAAKLDSPIPPDVQALDGKKAVIAGFLLPVMMNDGLAVEFLLMRNQSMCCYGVPPKINEWITVQTSGQGVKPVMDQPILVAGTLRVGEILDNGSLAGIYRMDADKIIQP